jgi:hypothetical protein
MVKLHGLANMMFSASNFSLGRHPTNCVFCPHVVAGCLCRATFIVSRKGRVASVARPELHVRRVSARIHGAFDEYKLKFSHMDIRHLVNSIDQSTFVKCLYCGGLGPRRSQPCTIHLALCTPSRTLLAIAHRHLLECCDRSYSGLHVDAVAFPALSYLVHPRFVRRI